MPGTSKHTSDEPDGGTAANEAENKWKGEPVGCVISLINRPGAPRQYDSRTKLEATGVRVVKDRQTF